MRWASKPAGTVMACAFGFLERPVRGRSIPQMTLRQPACTTRAAAPISASEKAATSSCEEINQPPFALEQGQQVEAGGVHAFRRRRDRCRGRRRRGRTQQRRDLRGKVRPRQGAAEAGQRRAQARPKRRVRWVSVLHNVCVKGAGLGRKVKWVIRRPGKIRPPRGPRWTKPTGSMRADALARTVGAGQHSSPCSAGWHPAVSRICNPQAVCNSGPRRKGRAPCRCHGNPEHPGCTGPSSLSRTGREEPRAAGARRVGWGQFWIRDCQNNME